MPQKHYIWECDYGDREPVLNALGIMLRTTGACEMPMAALFVNNSPYCFEFYVAFGFETAIESQIALMQKLMQEAGAKLRSDITLEILVGELEVKRFNSAAISTEETLKTVRDTSMLFLTPDKKCSAPGTLDTR